VDYNLKSYVKIYKNFYDKKTCKKIIKRLESSNTWETHTYHNIITNEKKPLSGDNELEVSFYHDNLTSSMMDDLWFGLEKYFSELNFEWCLAWEGYSAIRFNRYQQNQTMRLHCDHIKTLFSGEVRGVPILSLLIQLNDRSEYTGGEFVLFDEEKEIDLNAGDLIIFPSNFLFPHKVNPVVEGTRYSAISWAF
jgi:hypothetical protein